VLEGGSEEVVSGSVDGVIDEKQNDDLDMDLGTDMMTRSETEEWMRQ
jgi:hypothetical protein